MSSQINIVINAMWLVSFDYVLMHIKKKKKKTSKEGIELSSPPKTKSFVIHPQLQFVILCQHININIYISHMVHYHIII
jgi:hypothetical protein